MIVWLLGFDFNVREILLGLIGVGLPRFLGGKNLGNPHIVTRHSHKNKRNIAKPLFINCRRFLSSRLTFAGLRNRLRYSYSDSYLTTPECFI